MIISWTEVQDIVKEIKYKDWTLVPRFLDIGLYTIRWVFMDNGEKQICREWMVDMTQPKSDIVRTALAAAIMAEEHETREKFTYRGKRIFGPHFDVNRLVEISGKLENLEIPNAN